MLTYLLKITHNYGFGSFGNFISSSDERIDLWLGLRTNIHCLFFYVCFVGLGEGEGHGVVCEILCSVVQALVINYRNQAMVLFSLF